MSLQKNKIEFREQTNSIENGKVMSKKNQLTEAKKIESFLKAILAIVLCLLFFCLGVYFGKIQTQPVAKISSTIKTNKNTKPKKIPPDNTTLAKNTAKKPIKIQSEDNNDKIIKSKLNAASNKKNKTSDIIKDDASKIAIDTSNKESVMKPLEKTINIKPKKPILEVSKNTNNNTENITDKNIEKKSVSILSRIKNIFKSDSEPSKKTLTIAKTTENSTDEKLKIAQASKKNSRAEKSDISNLEPAPAPIPISKIQEKKNTVAKLENNLKADIEELKKKTSKPKSIAKKLYIAKESNTSTSQKGLSPKSFEYTIQLASFNKESDTIALLNELLDDGFAAFTMPAEVRGQTWYRVCVGVFSSVKKAKAYKKQLLKQIDQTDGLVVKMKKNR